MKQELLNAININTEKLNEKKIHSRQDTLQILGISGKTLKKYDKEGLISPTRFRGKLYYPSTEIVKCIKRQFNMVDDGIWEKYWE